MAWGGIPPLHLFDSCPRRLHGSGQPLSMLLLPLEMKAFSHGSENLLPVPTSHSTLNRTSPGGRSNWEAASDAAANLKGLVCFGMLLVWGGGFWALGWMFSPLQPPPFPPIYSEVKEEAHLMKHPDPRQTRAEARR